MRGVRRDPERSETRALRKHLHLIGARLLDIGCGEGRLTRRLAGLAAAVVGIDTDRSLVARASRLTPQRLHRKVQFRLGGAQELSFQDHSFDVAVFSWSF